MKRSFSTTATGNAGGISTTVGSQRPVADLTDEELIAELLGRFQNKRTSRDGTNGQMALMDTTSEHSAKEAIEQLEHENGAIEQLIDSLRKLAKVKKIAQVEVARSTSPLLTLQDDLLSKVLSFLDHEALIVLEEATPEGVPKPIREAQWEVLEKRRRLDGRVTRAEIKALDEVQERHHRQDVPITNKWGARERGIFFARASKYASQMEPVLKELKESRSPKLSPFFTRWFLCHWSPNRHKDQIFFLRISYQDPNAASAVVVHEAFSMQRTQEIRRYDERIGESLTFVVESKALAMEPFVAEYKRDEKAVLKNLNVTALAYNTESTVFRTRRDIDRVFLPLAIDVDVPDDITTSYLFQSRIEVELDSQQLTITLANIAPY